MVKFSDRVTLIYIYIYIIYIYLYIYIGILCIGAMAHSSTKHILMGYSQPFGIMRMIDMYHIRVLIQIPTITAMYLTTISRQFASCLIRLIKFVFLASNN